jgi:transposase
MLYAGLDLSRKRLDFRLLDEAGETVETGASPPDADGLRGLAGRVARFGEPVRAAIESMNGARFVHDQLEQSGWEVEIADALEVKGLAPLACKTDRIDAWVLAELSRRDLVPSIWLPHPEVRAERERARFRLHLVRHRSSLKQRVHAVLLAHGTPCIERGSTVRSRQRSLPTKTCKQALLLRGPPRGRKASAGAPPAGHWRPSHSGPSRRATPSQPGCRSARRRPRAHRFARPSSRRRHTRHAPHLRKSCRYGRTTSFVPAPSV